MNDYDKTLEKLSETLNTPSNLPDTTPDTTPATQAMTNSDKKTLLWIVIVVGSLCIWLTWLLVNSSLFSSPPPAPAKPQITRGWLCDYDQRSEVALWENPALAFENGNQIVDVVGMALGGCVDVTLLETTTNNGILFYKIRVGSQSGWVDVDYYYPRKPSWATYPQ